MTVLDTDRRPPPAVVVRRIGLIAVPILLASLASLFAPLVNTAVMGHHDAALLYPLALALPLILLQTSVNESLRVSSVAFSSQASGSGDLATYRRRLHGLVTIGVLVNLALAALFAVGHGAFLDAYGVPAGQRPLVYAFVQLTVLTGALLMVSVGLMSSLYGFGQVRAVTVVTVTGLAGNVALTAVLVAWLGLFAMPAATVVSATATIGWAARRLAGLGALPRLSASPWAAVAGSWRQIARISAPVSLGYLLLFVNGLVFTQILARHSALDVAGFGVAYRIQNLVLMPAIAIGVGLAITVNRMVAAGRPEPVPAFLSTTLLLAVTVFAGLGALLFAVRGPVTGWLAGDPAVAGAAGRYFTYVAPAYLVAGPLLMLMIFLEETGNGLRALTFNAALVAGQLLLAHHLTVTGHPVWQVYLALAVTYPAAVVFIAHELIRARRLGGRVSAITPT